MTKLLMQFGTRGYERGQDLSYLAWKLLRNNTTTTMTVEEVTVETKMREFCYAGTATALSKLVKSLIQPLILDLQADELTDEVKDAICKPFEQEIVTLACLRTMLGWKEKAIHDELLSFLKRD